MLKRLFGRNGANGAAPCVHGQLRTFLDTARRVMPPIVAASEPIDQAIGRSVSRLYSLQHDDGHWVARMDSNSAINAEYIMTMHYMGRVDEQRQRRLAQFIFGTQLEDGGWPTYIGGPGNLSVAITCYYGLRLAGYPAEDPRLARAREFILAAGGILQSKFECKFLLCLFGQFPWRGLAHMPVYLTMAPGWFTFAPQNLSYWARCCLVPMVMLYNMKASVTASVGCDELYVEPRGSRRYSPSHGMKLFSWENFFIQGGRLLKLFELCTGRLFNHLGMIKAEEWLSKHQNDSGDWGGIYPSMMYSLMALKARGLALTDSSMVRGWAALERFEVEDERGLMMQACVSPVWDTCWVLLTLEELESADPQRCRKARRFLYDNQIFRDGDWASQCPEVAPAGWCFQHHNDFYPDLDDSAVVLMALIPRLEEDSATDRQCFELGVQWLLALQNEDGGWAAFDKNLNRQLINHLPFNDIDNMLDPSTADLTGRLLELFGQLGMNSEHAPVARGLEYLKGQQESFGGWYGRWGVNYIYGTWSVLRGLIAIGEDPAQDYIQRAVSWIKGCQQADGSWGESCDSYEDVALAGQGESTPSQTAWALLALLAVGEADCTEVARGVAYLAETQSESGEWAEDFYTGTGFPGAFYLRYYMYALYFPLQALGNYRKAILEGRARA